MSNDTQPRFVSKARFAAMLDTAEGTIDAWIESGRVAAVQPGGPGTRWMIPVSEADRLMDEAFARQQQALHRIERAPLAAEAYSVYEFGQDDDPTLPVPIDTGRPVETELRLRDRKGRVHNSGEGGLSDGDAIPTLDGF